MGIVFALTMGIAIPLIPIMNASSASAESAALADVQTLSGAALRAQVGLFLADFDAFAASRGVREGPLSKLLFGRSGRVADLRKGGGINVETLAQVRDHLERLKSESGNGEAA